MSKIARDPEASPVELQAYQAAFVETALSRASKRIVLLRGAVGLGKTTALVALASRMMREQPEARALILCPAALRSQWVDKLRNEGTPVLLVDRYRFREMLVKSSGADLWPRGTVAVLSDDFAKQPDIRESLAGAHWDLVVADEAHRFVGTRAELLQRVGATAERVVLATIPSITPGDAFPISDATVVDWQRDQLVDYDGKPLDTGSRPVLHEVPFSLCRAEQDLSKTVRALCQALEAGSRQQEFVAKILLRSLHSSPAALERVLRSLVVMQEEQGEINELIENSEEMVAEAISPKQIDPTTAKKAREIAGRALQELEVIQVDSKLDAFGALLGYLTEIETLPRRICVISEYLGTLYYLAAEINGRGLACPLLHGGMRYEDRLEFVTKFVNTGGILVATIAVMTEGVDLRHVTDVILYDLPANELALHVVLGRFDRLGRTNQLNVHALVGSDDTDGALLESLRHLHDKESGRQGSEKTSGDIEDGQS